MIAYKFLRSGALGLITREPWPAPPRAGEPGAWRESPDGPLVPCHRGLHACHIGQLGYWLSDELWQVELDGERIETQHSLVSRRMRLLRRIDAWQGSAGQAFAQACATRAEAAFAAASAPPALAREYLEQAQAFLRAGGPALTAYAAALVASALVPPTAAMATFDAERQQQGHSLAQLAGL